MDPLIDFLKGNPCLALLPGCEFENQGYEKRVMSLKKLLENADLLKSGSDR